MRGINKPLKKKKMQEYLKKHHINLASLLETKVRAHKFQDSIKRCAKEWAYLNNYDFVESGRI